MNILILVIFLLYFGILYLISYLVSQRGTDNDAFFRANRKSPWYVVTIGMIGTSISGVTFVSVPGMVEKFDMTYMQMVFGFFVGYIVVAYILLPLYYKLNLTTIYTYLHNRFGVFSYKTGASFFILSRIIGSSAKLYLVALILQTLVLYQFKVPFYLTVSIIVLMIWMYTRKSGIKTIVWTDTLQTISFLIALMLIIWQVSSYLGFDLKQTAGTITSNTHSQIFVFNDWGSPSNFFKQFLSGVFIVIVMTGLDQDIMQKNLTCKNLKDAQKNMLTYGFMFIPVNLLFLCLGVLLLVFAHKYNITLPNISDERLPYLVNNYLGLPCLIFFAVGLVGASFSNADSALTSLTTSFCIDILNVEKRTPERANRTRQWTHIGMCVIFVLVIIAIHEIGPGNILNAIYKIASYTYGPLLGMFALGLFSKTNIKDKYAPIVCISAPILCYMIEVWLTYKLNYTIGYELLILNGLLTIIGLLLIRRKNSDTKTIS